MTTSPSWHEAWPTSFPDVEAIYEETVPTQFPRGLYFDIESDEAKDISATAVVLSWVAQGSQWVRGRLMPQQDTTGLFTALWETAMGLLAKGTIAERNRAVIRYARYALGTATAAAVQAMMAPLYNEEGNPGAISFAAPSVAQRAAAAPYIDDYSEAKASTSLHIYHTSETTAPDRKAALDAIAQIKPATETWSIGQYQTALYDTEGGYDTACYG